MKLYWIPFFLSLCFIIIVQWYVVVFTGVLPFPFLPSTPTTSDNSTKTSVLLTGSSKLVNNQLNSSGENQEVDARGLVTGAPSPPDLKGTAVNPKATTDSHSLAPQNGTERSCNNNYCPLLEVNSCNEDELMIVEQTPPTKVDKKEKVRNFWRRQPVLIRK